MGSTIPCKVVLYGVPLNPITPVKAAGILMLPPKSAPTAAGTHLAATSPASPPEEPPQVLTF